MNSTGFSDIIKDIKPSASMAIGLSKLPDDGINLAIGVSDLDTPQFVRSALLNEISNGHRFPYLSSKGSAEARKNVIDVLLADDHSDSIDNIMLVPGSKWGISLVLQTLLNENDKVVLCEPFWLGYPELVKIHRSKAVSWKPQINNGTNLVFEIADLKSILEKEKPKVLLINNPNNPSGEIFSESFIKEVLDLTKKNNCWVILDEVYKHLVFPGIKYSTHSIHTYPNLIKIGSISKSLSVPGLRAGYIYASKEFIDKADLLQQHEMTCINSLADSVFKNINTSDYISFTTTAAEIYSKRFNVWKTIADKTPLSVLHSNASFYVLCSTGTSGLDGTSFCEKLAAKYHVYCTPGIAYGESFKNYFRVCLTQSDPVLSEAMNRIKLFCDENI